MSITLTQLLSEISLAVQKANNAIDEYSALSYIDQGYDMVDSEQNITPKSYNNPVSLDENDTADTADNNSLPIANSFVGLPIETLIGSPFIAAAN